MERRRSSRRTVVGDVTFGITYSDARSTLRTASVKLIDEGDEGFCFASPVQLPKETLITVRDGSGSKLPTHLIGKRARVRYCSAEKSGGFRAGARLETASAKQDGDGTATAQSADDQDFSDHYEIMQLNAKADQETVQRVFRILAQRYHPDNQETGDADMFHQLMTAYAVLSDPEKRAAYDARHTATRTTRWKIFNNAQTTQGSEGERRKRLGILSLLYTKRISDLHQPTMTIRELEDLLGCPKEHLEFSLWYLKERGHVARSDNGRYSITVDGVDAAETLEREPSSAPRPHLLPGANVGLSGRAQSPATGSM